MNSHHLMQYIGLIAIAKRLGYKTTATVGRLIVRDGLPAYRIGHPKKPNHYRWVIDDQLILAWQLERARLHRQDLIDKRKYDAPGIYDEIDNANRTQPTHISHNDDPHIGHRGQHSGPVSEARTTLTDDPPSPDRT